MRPSSTATLVSFAGSLSAFAFGFGLGFCFAFFATVLSFRAFGLPRKCIKRIFRRAQHPGSITERQTDAAQEPSFLKECAFLGFAILQAKKGQRTSNDGGNFLHFWFNHSLSI